MTEAEWKAKARAFAQLFCEVYYDEAVTPYLHVFVYHIGYYIEKYQRKLDKSIAYWIHYS